jgi:site-specific recombinase XerD
MGTEMIKEHGELIAQKVLGHASLDTTRIYDKRGDDVLRKIMSERK